MEDTLTNHNEKKKCQELCCKSVHSRLGYQCIKGNENISFCQLPFHAILLFWDKWTYYFTFLKSVAWSLRGRGGLPAIAQPFSHVLWVVSPACKLQAAILFPISNSAVARVWGWSHKSRAFYTFNCNCSWMRNLIACNGYHFDSL